MLPLILPTTSLLTLGYLVTNSGSYQLVTPYAFLNSLGLLSLIPLAILPFVMYVFTNRAVLFGGSLLSGMVSLLSFKLFQMELLFRDIIPLRLGFYLKRIWTEPELSHFADSYLVERQIKASELDKTRILEGANNIESLKENLNLFIERKLNAQETANTGIVVYFSNYLTSHPHLVLGITACLVGLGTASYVVWQFYNQTAVSAAETVFESTKAIDKTVDAQAALVAELLKSNKDILAAAKLLHERCNLLETAMTQVGEFVEPLMVLKLEEVRYLISFTQENYAGAKSNIMEFLRSKINDK